MRDIIIIILSSLGGYMILALLRISGFNFFENDLLGFVGFYMPVIVATVISAFFARHYPLKKFLIIVFLSQLLYVILWSLYGPDGVFIDMETCSSWDSVKRQLIPHTSEALLSCLVENIVKDVSAILLPAWILIGTLFYIRRNR